MKRRKTAKVMAMMLAFVVPFLAGAGPLLHLDVWASGVNSEMQWQYLAGRNGGTVYQLDSDATQSYIDEYLSDESNLEFDYSESLAIMEESSCQEVIDQGYGLAGDIDCDCYITMADFADIASDWSKCVDPCDPNCAKPWL